jgi:probable HAF family extracellular repeat protein
MYRRIGLVFVLTICLFVVGSTGSLMAAPAAVPSYSVVDLGTLPGSQFGAVANSINNQGQVVGSSWTAGTDGNVQHAFLWQASSGMRDLGTLPGGYTSQALDINDKGQVVGVSDTASHRSHAFLWQASTGMQDLGTLLPSDLGSNAMAINEQGQAVGTGETAAGLAYAFLWQASTGMQDLGTLPGDLESGAIGINNQGQVTGWSRQQPSNSRDFLWQASTGMQNLTVLASPAFVVTYPVINDSGQIADGRWLWQAGKGVVDIGILPSYQGSAANAINDRGQVVGESGSEDVSSAFIWDASTGIRELAGLPGSRVTVANGINDQGEVVGSSGPLGGAPPTHAVLWQPTATGTPPTTMAVLAPLPSAGWNRSNVTVTLTATAASGGLPVQSLTYSTTGAQTITSTTVQGSTVTIPISAEGVTTLSYFATDQAGNQEQPKFLTVRIDKTPPTVICQASPSTLWPPNGKLVPVQVNVSVTDPNGSGPNGYTLVSITSNEGDIATQQQGLVVGTASTSGFLQAARAGNVTNRLYTLTYQASDVAGNTATCTTTVTVPHDQRH